MVGAFAGAALLTLGGFVAPAPAAAVGTSVYLIAGNGTTTATGDGGPATAAGLDTPQDITYDTVGNLYVSQPRQSIVRKVATDGTISTVAGIAGSPGFDGDGGPATSALLNWPRGLAFRNGYLYVSDSGNQRIRRIRLSTGTISTIAGDGTAAYSGDGGPASAAQLNWAGLLSFDVLGNLYLADTLNHRIRRIGSDGVITTVAGNGTPGMADLDEKATDTSINQPAGVAVRVLQNVMYISETLSNRILALDLLDGTLNLIAGAADGSPGPGSASPVTATQARFHWPSSIYIDSLGNLLVADSLNHEIRSITLPLAVPPLPPIGLVTRVAGTGTAGVEGDPPCPNGSSATACTLLFPKAMAVSSLPTTLDAIFISDTGHHRVLKIGTTAGLLTP